MRANIKGVVYIKMTLEHILREYLTKNNTLVYFAKPKNLKPKVFKKSPKFAKSPNQNICSQMLSFARFSESGDKLANMATLALTAPDSHLGNCVLRITYKLSNSVWCIALRHIKDFARQSAWETLVVTILLLQHTTGKVNWNVAVAAM